MNIQTSNIKPTHNKKEIHRKTITTNGLFSFAAKIAAMLVPFVVYPYVMRTLGSESFGKVSYVQALISYFGLLAILGIDNYALRECSVVRDNYDKLRQKASQVFAINIIMTTVSLVIYFSLLYMVPAMQNELVLYIIFAFNIIGGGLSLNWIYTAQERFDIVSIREIIAKLFYLGLCFALIKTSDNYILYGAIIVFTSAIFPMLWNMVGILKGECGVIPSLKYSKGFSNCLKPVFFLALLTIGSKLFTDFDVLMIKWFSSGNSDAAVGLYNSAIILPKAFDDVLMTVSAVITPRLFIASRQDTEVEVMEIMKKTSNALFLIALPAIITLLMFPSEILLLFAGPEYLLAAPVLQVYSLIIIGVLVITLAGTRIYIARRKEYKLFLVLICGAVLNIVLNYIFIKQWGILGSALATLCVYVVVMSIELTLEKTWHYIFTIDKIKYLVAGSSLVVVFWSVHSYLSLQPVLLLSIAILTAGILYLLLLYIMRESTILQIKDKVSQYLKK